MKKFMPKIYTGKPPVKGGYYSTFVQPFFPKMGGPMATAPKGKKKK